MEDLKRRYRNLNIQLFITLIVLLLFKANTFVYIIFMFYFAFAKKNIENKFGEEEIDKTYIRKMNLYLGIVAFTVYVLYRLIIPYLN